MKRILLGFAAGITVALVAGMLIVNSGLIYRDYYVNTIPGWSTTAGVNSIRRDTALSRGCEVVSSLILRCPFWVSP